MPENVFEIKNAVYGYEKKTEILHGITADILLGKITALIGPNGCGKTTTYRCPRRKYEIAYKKRAYGNQPVQ